MTSYSFHLDRLLADPQQGTALILQTIETSAELRVRVGSADAEQIALALAGLSTPAARLAQLVRRLAEQLDARPAHLLLQRTTGSLIEASLVLQAGLEQVSIPVTFGDAVVLARVNGLPLQGDISLSAMLRVTPPEREEPAAPPPAFATFFDALGAE
jgi:hypothetical protein